MTDWSRWQTIKHSLTEPLAIVIHTGTFSECVKWRDAENVAAGIYAMLCPTDRMSWLYWHGRDTYGVRHISLDTSAHPGTL